MFSLTKDLGIDLGTIQTRIADSSGVIVDEPTIVAIVIAEQKIVAMGNDAQGMSGRVSTELSKWPTLSKTAWSPITRLPKPFCITCSSGSAARCVSFAPG